MSRSTLADIETGRRRYVSTAELTIIAWALAVPPVQLLYPPMPDGTVEVVPGTTARAFEAAAWFSGELTFNPAKMNGRLEERERIRSVELYQGELLVRLARERMTLETRIATLVGMAEDLKSEGHVESAQMTIDQIFDARRDLQEVLRQLGDLPNAVVRDGEG